MKNLLLSLLITITSQSCIFAQNEKLRNIIDLDISETEKEKKVDSLYKHLQKNYKDRLGDFYHDIASKWYYPRFLNKGDNNYLNDAILNTRKAILEKENSDVIDTISLRKSIYNLAFFQYQSGEIFSSIDTHIKLLSFNIEDQKSIGSRKDLSISYLEVGDFQKAIETLNQILSLSKNDAKKWQFLLNTHILLADSYGTMNYADNKSEMEYHLKQADSLVKANKLEKSFQDNQIKVLYGNLYLKTGRFSTAKNMYKQVLSNPSVFSKKELAIVYNNYGYCLLQNNEIEEALNNINLALQTLPNYSLALESLGDLNLQKNNYKEGLEYYQKSILAVIQTPNLSKIMDLPNTEEIELTKDKLNLLRHIIAKANGWAKYYKYKNNNNFLVNSLQTFKKADELIDIIKRENTEFQSKVYWREQSSELYANAIETCFLLKRPEEAFYYMERNKALLLLEDLSNEDAKQIANIPTEKAQQEFNLKRAIFLSENKLQEQKGLIDNDSLEVLKTTIRNNKYKYERFIHSLEVSYPNYAKFKKKVDVLPLNDLQTKYITEDKATLHYILNEEDGYGLLTTTDTTLLFRLKNIPKINEEVELLIAALADGVSDIDNFTTISNKVFQDLIPEKVYQKILGKQLTIIPDYTLQQIPFESLVIDSTNLKYLFEEVEIGYAYSASLLHHNQKTAQHSDIDLLGVAPIVFNDLKLPELFFSKNEVKNIAEVFPSKILLNNEATKTNFIENVANHSVLHLATHADIGDGENPWVAFSDSKMYLKEIYATKNQADMVVLSGCNTSNGALKRGEGVMSLARGFFYSGAKSVVSTLWPVSDEAGKEILINFYKNLNEGLTKSKALQKAKLAYLKNTEEKELKHPYYWAGYVALGDNSPLTDEPISNWQFLVYAVIGSGILILGYTKVKRHRAAA
ncbi:CHAT domain-containing protein [Zobellia amurskyensis]|uniref:CHAT domain-containing protein n=1 Tax=Zobellia amurskyensis TaxID=248905 RepID=A0A7X2ZQS8_9FLAO|nr:CHAT domain-containing protein [Zobellia amurskyensis]MUH34680.1 CHAT domain-containing protein [Zobellia amurskyensis]